MIIYPKSKKRNIKQLIAREFTYRDMRGDLYKAEKVTMHGFSAHVDISINGKPDPKGIDCKVVYFPDGRTGIEQLTYE